MSADFEMQFFLIDRYLNTDHKETIGNLIWSIDRSIIDQILILSPGADFETQFFLINRSLNTDHMETFGDTIW